MCPTRFGTGRQRVNGPGDNCYYPHRDDKTKRNEKSLKINAITGNGFDIVCHRRCQFKKKQKIIKRFSLDTQNSVETLLLPDPIGKSAALFLNQPMLVMSALARYRHGSCFGVDRPVCSSVARSAFASGHSLTYCTPGVLISPEVPSTLLN